MGFQAKQKICVYISLQYSQRTRIRVSAFLVHFGLLQPFLSSADGGSEGVPKNKMCAWSLEVHKVQTGVLKEDCTYNRRLYLQQGVLQKKKNVLVVKKKKKKKKKK